MIVAIEGIDGSGKHTQAQKLSAWLDSINVRNEVYDFPHYETSESVASHAAETMR